MGLEESAGIWPTTEQRHLAAPPSAHKPDIEDRLEDRLREATKRYEERHPRSRILHERAAQSLPGGNTRTVLHASPWPIYIKRGERHQVFDEDGHTYTDLTGELSAGLFGHSDPTLVNAMKSTLDDVGLNLGGTTEQEAKYAALLCSRFNLERVRFANSGTEANLHALAAARHYTGKRRVVVFTNGYHGAVLGFGHGVAPNTVDRDDWIVAKYNDVSSAKQAIESKDVSAVIVEGMQGSGGCIPATKDFMQAVQHFAKQAGIIFILDEVMTSRLAPGGLQSTMGLSPDLTTFGKWLGGGLAFGAFGGGAQVMGVFDPRLANSLAHSGTFNNNTLAMHAGYMGLASVYTPEVCEAFTATGSRLLERLQHICQGTRCSWTGIGTVMNSHFAKDETNEDLQLKDLFWMDLLEQGFWVSRRGMLALVLHTPQEELDRFVDAVAAFLERYRNVLAESI